MYLTPKQRQEALANVPKQEMSLEEFQAKYKAPLPPGKKPRKKSVKKPVQMFYPGKCELNKSWINIGIDPDRDKSGIAVWKRSVGSIQGFYVFLGNLTFFPLLDYVKNAYPPETTVIYLEAAWLIKKKNFHKDKGEYIREKMAGDVGANHESGRKLLEGFVDMGYSVLLIKPEPGKPKWNAETFMRATVLPDGHNEEVRDAARLVFNS